MQHAELPSPSLLCYSLLNYAAPSEQCCTLLSHGALCSPTLHLSELCCSKSSHPTMAALTSKRRAASRGRNNSKKIGRCHLIKEKDAKNKNSLCGGGQPRWRPKPSPRPPRCGIVPKIGGFWRSHQFPPRGRGP
jgi:hypothetical protein